MNFFVADVADPQSGRGVFLDTFTNCGGPSGWSRSRTLISNGTPPSFQATIPSVATKGTAEWGDLFVVWSTAGSLKGRMLRHRQGVETWTNTIEFNAFSGFSTDAIYNVHSNKWIIGSMRGVEGGYSTSAFAFSSDDNAIPALVDGFTSGASGDGHHTAVAYNPLSPDGSYVWWRQNQTELSKSFYLHDKNGAEVVGQAPLHTAMENTDPPHQSEGHSDYTMPAAATNSADIPYVMLLNDGFFGLTSDKKWTSLDHANTNLGQPLAVRSLEGGTVGLVWNGGIRVVSTDAPVVPVVESLQDRAGAVTAFFTDARDGIHNAYALSYTGAETWQEQPAYMPLRTAKEIAVVVNDSSAPGRKEIVYIGADNVLRHLLEWTPGSNTFQDLGYLVNSTTKARQIVVARNADQTASVFYIRYPDDVLCFTRQTAPNTSTWGAESQLAGTTRAYRLAVATLPSNQLQVAFIGKDVSPVYAPSGWQGALGATWQTSQNSNSWTTASRLGGATSVIAYDLTMVSSGPSAYPEIVFAAPSSSPWPYEIIQPDPAGTIAAAVQTSVGVWTIGPVASGGPKRISAAYSRNGAAATPSLKVVFVGANSELYWTEKNPASGAWSSPALVTSIERTAKRVSIASNALSSGRLEVFYWGLDDVLRRTSWISEQTGFYPPSVLHGTPSSRVLTAGVGNGGNVQALGVNDDGAPVLQAWRGASNWTAGFTLQPPSGAPGFNELVAGNGNQGYLQLLGRGATDGRAYLANWQDGGGGWHPGFLIPGQTTTYSALALGTGLGQLRLLGLGASDRFAYLISSQDASGNWNPGSLLPSQSTPLAAVTTGVGGGLLRVLGLGLDGYVYQVSSLENSGTWTPGSQLPGQTVQLSAFAAGSGNSGVLQVVGLGPNGQAYLAAWQDGGGSWHSGFQLPGQIPALSTIAAGRSGDTLQMVGLGASDGLPYVASSQDSAGNWYPGGILASPGVPLSKLALTTDDAGSLLVLGLGDSDGRTYLAAWRGSDGAWHAGYALN